MRRTITLLLVVPLALAACGDDDDASDAIEPSTTSTPTTTSTTSTIEASETTAPAEEQSTGEAVTIDIANFAFDPEGVEVAVGQEVVWANADDFTHTAQADAFDTGDIAAGAASEPIVFDEPGTYSYFCGIHNSMTGTITVTG
jgi:plastocyanin